ncbi:uncharacterized protein DFL_009902 [Arthrobotrys flagrans]|uniref:Uncharacterized protein n=1 Tax=Arthrobotrys flagrans TaxID=97331 RepID=A0A436ZT10_ARTFL|nr:hypothetical protein DFL_009902 [Arthrobotrys flagrans]
MFFALGNLLAAAALFKALPVKAAPYPFVLEERTGSGGCNADNLLRLLRTPSNLPEALPFCSSYLGLPASTTTVSTVTPTVTSYTTAVTIETALFTESPVVSLTLTATETSVIVATTTITVGVQAPYERLARHCTSTTSRASTTKSTTSFPEKVTGTTYEPSRISSACSCLTIPIAISSVTATAPEVTQTITVSSTSSTSETVTITSTESISITETTTVFSTVTETSTNAASPTAYALKVVAPGTPDDGYFVYNRNENPTNTGPNASQVFPITSDDSQATKFLFNADGTLEIAVSSTLYTSSVVGQESSAWVHFNHPSLDFEALYSNKRTSINGCGSCITVKWQKDSVTGFVTPSNVAKVVSICTLPNTGYGRGVYFGMPTNNFYACIAANLLLVPLY